MTEMELAKEHPFAHYFMLRDMVASIALSHAERCSCDVCKAAHGDEGAFLRLLTLKAFERC